MKVNICLIKSARISLIKLKVVYKRILVIPVPIATAERSFSTTRKIKRYNGSIMIGKRLKKLQFCYQLKSEELKKNPYEIPNEFACYKTRILRI